MSRSPRPRSAEASSPMAAPSIATCSPPRTPRRSWWSRPARPTSTPSRLVDAAADLVRRRSARRRGASTCSRRPDALDAGQRRRAPRRRLPLPRRRVADAHALGAQGHARCGTRSSRRGRRRGRSPDRWPVRWSAATRWSTPAAAPSPSASGLVANLAVIPEFDTWSEDAIHRTRKLSPADLALVGVPRRTALIRDPDGPGASDGALAGDRVPRRRARRRRRARLA